MRRLTSAWRSTPVTPAAIESLGRNLSLAAACLTRSVSQKLNLSPYIPRHKGDLDAAREAVRIGYVALKPVIPQILEWHQDYNWPVAHVLNDLYRDADTDIIPHLDRILKSDDWSWKYWIVSTIIPEISIDASKHFIPQLQRLAETPTDDERHNEIDDVAKTALQKIRAKEG